MESLEQALETIKAVAETVETPEQFAALYDALANGAGFVHRAVPVFAESRPGEFVVRIRYDIVKYNGGA